MRVHQQAHTKDKLSMIKKNRQQIEIPETSNIGVTRYIL